MKINYILDNFYKFATIYQRIIETEDMTYKLFRYIVPIVFIDYETYELNFDNEEIKQDNDYRKKFFENICQILDNVKPEQQIKIVYKIFEIFEFQEVELIDILFNNIERLIIQEKIYNVITVNNNAIIG